MYGTREYSLLVVVHQHSRASCYGEREGGVLHEQRGIGNERMASSPLLQIRQYTYWYRYSGGTWVPLLGTHNRFSTSRVFYRPRSLEHTQLRQVSGFMLISV
jgi:hypothetical protein